MLFSEFSSRVEKVYNIIMEREKEQHTNYIKNGLYVSHISFEDIDLDDIFRTELVPLIPPIFDYYSDYRVRNIIEKIYKTYIAALCEIAKNGFTQGGILKTIDAYIGYEFDRNRHYDLLRQALKHENIKILHERSHHYEETIIFESGIPKTFHKDALTLFLLYWKWMKGVDSDERRAFLKDFIDEKTTYESYIFDRLDYSRMKHLRELMITFKEKLLKTCIRLELIFGMLDEYIGLIDENNIDEVCDQISERVGFNIQTVVRVKDIKQKFLAYTRRISFSKFQKIINNLPSTEKVLLPTGRLKTKEEYNIQNFYCGIHMLKDVTYEVSYPIGLSVKELTELPRKKTIKQNQNYIYISDEYFEVDIDGMPQRIRELVWDNEFLYVYMGKIQAASTAYMDGECVQGNQETKVSAFIRKMWDRDSRKNRLAIYLKEIKYSNKNNSMKQLSVSYESKGFTRQINQNGYARLTDKWLYIDENTGKSEVELTITIEGEMVESVELPLEPDMIFGLRSGIRIRNNIDLNQWYGDERIIVFSRSGIEIHDIEVEYLEFSQGYYIYSGKMDFTKSSFIINDVNIVIKHGDHAYIAFSSEYVLLDDKICFNQRDDICLQIRNIVDDHNQYFLKIAHDDLITNCPLQSIADISNIQLKTILDKHLDTTGKWSVAMYQEQVNVCEIAFAILPFLRAVFCQDLYMEGERVKVEVSSDSNCFDDEGALTYSIQREAGSAKVQMIGNLVTSETIDIEAYNSRCDVLQQISLKPNVWGVRLLDYQTQKWHKNKDVYLTYHSLDNYGVYICTTRPFLIKIQCNDGITFRELLPGFNKISIKRIFEKWLAVNQINFLDTNEQKQFIRIVFEPQLKPSKFYYDRSDLIGIFSYYGPVDTAISITAFAASVKISKISRTAECSGFSIRFIVRDVEKYQGSPVTFEARFDEQDSFVAATHKIEIPVIAKEIYLPEFIKVRTLLNGLKQEKTKKTTESLSVISVLKLLYAGGN